MIETDRLILKPISIKDVPGYQSAFEHPDFIYAAAVKASSAEAYVQNRLSKQNIDDPDLPFSVSYSIYLKAENNKIIGYRSYGDHHVIPRLSVYGMELGSFIHPDYWGNGYASEALGAALDYGNKTYGHHKFYATVSPDNKGSIRVLEKNGLRKVEDVTNSQELAFFNGDPRDVYGLTL